MTRPDWAEASRLARGLRDAPRRVALAALRLPVARTALRVLLDLPFDPYDRAFRADPYPAYTRLRERSPVYRSPLGVWLVTRYADAVALLDEPRFAHADYRAEARRRGTPSALMLLQSNVFISMNPPDHTRFRRGVAEVFTPQLMSDLRLRAQVIADRLLDRVKGARRMDAVADFALRLPVAVIGDMLGIPSDDATRCQIWARQASAAVELAPTRSELARAEAGTGRIIEYFRGMIGERRTRPGHDVISALVRAQEHGRWDDDELLASCILLFTAGYETTVAFVGTAILTLLRHPAAWEALQADPGLVRSGVDELLRYESPIQLFGRQAQEDVVLGGQPIRRGQTVFVLVGAVNRDPVRFPDPERVDLGRRDNPHLAFGHGIHACLGQGLARLEGQVVLETLVRRLPSLRFGTGPIVWRDSLALRALDSLPVAW